MEAERLPFGMWFDGRSHPLWHYRELPEGMRRAGMSDMYHGRPFLYQVEIGPDAGGWYTGYYAGNDEAPARWRLLHDIPLYVKD